MKEFFSEDRKHAIGCQVVSTGSANKLWGMARKLNTTATELNIHQTSSQVEVISMIAAQNSGHASPLNNESQRRSANYARVFLKYSTTYQQHKDKGQFIQLASMPEANGRGWSLFVNNCEPQHAAHFNNFIKTCLQETLDALWQELTARNQATAQWQPPQAAAQQWSQPKATAQQWQPPQATAQQWPQPQTAAHQWPQPQAAAQHWQPPQAAAQHWQPPQAAARQWPQPQATAQHWQPPQAAAYQSQPPQAAASLPTSAEAVYHTAHKAAQCYDKEDIMGGREEAIKIEGKIDTLSKDHSSQAGYTALYLACKAGNLPAVKLLLDYRANPNIMNHLSATPLSVATKAGHQGIIAALISAGAQQPAAQRPQPKAAGAQQAQEAAQRQPQELAAKADHALKNRNPMLAKQILQETAGAQHFELAAQIACKIGCFEIQHAAQTNDTTLAKNALLPLLRTLQSANASNEHRFAKEILSATKTAMQIAASSGRFKLAAMIQKEIKSTMITVASSHNFTLAKMIQSRFIPPKSAPVSISATSIFKPRPKPTVDPIMQALANKINQIQQKTGKGSKAAPKVTGTDITNQFQAIRRALLGTRVITPTQQKNLNHAICIALVQAKGSTSFDSTFSSTLCTMAREKGISLTPSQVSKGSKKLIALSAKEGSPVKELSALLERADVTSSKTADEMFSDTHSPDADSSASMAY